MKNVTRCRSHRKVNSCEECLRYRHCHFGEPLGYKNYEACLRLGYAIIGDVLFEYQKEYSKGNKSRCQFLEKWLRSERVDILTAELYDGDALADGIKSKCQKKYGNLDDIYEKKKQKVLKNIKHLKDELKDKNLSSKQKGRIQSQINNEKGELNL